jgi:hypothetical protein
MSVPSIRPFDAPNRRTIAQGHPTDWRPPRPKDIYELLVVGGGPCGLTAAITAAKAGHTVALAERNLTGGTCVNFGCTPSKSLLRAARAVFQARGGEKFGYTLGTAPRIDFAAVMTRVREMRAFSSSLDAVAVAAGTGIDVFLGDARFVARDTVEVDGRRLRFKKALIATGSRPAIPNIPGLAATRYLTNETAFELTELPMKVWQCDDLRPVPGLVPAEVKTPQPGRGEVLIRIHAVGVTHTELLWQPTTHTKSGENRRHAIPGHEFSGTIAAVGAGADGIVGQEVFGMNDWYAQGATAEFCCAPPSAIAPKPARLTPAEAASVPIDALTAWQGLFFVEPNRQQLGDVAAMLDDGQLRPGISAAVPFDQAAVAYAREPVRNRRPGKTVVTLIPPS